jgi:pimeloyl-ACP methyl ester carboxylesterase
MERIEFASRSNLRLVGNLWHADSSCAVVMVHGLFSDKNAHGMFPVAAQTLRQCGWSSLSVDLSGSGESDDCCMSLQTALSDVRSAINLMRSMGYRHLSLWGHGLGSRFCLEMPAGIESMVLTDALLGRTAVDWRTIFTPDELAGLSKLGHVIRTVRSVHRKRIMVDRSLLDYFSKFEPGVVLRRVRCPVQVIHPTRSVEVPGDFDSLRALMHLLPPKSQHTVLPGTHLSVTEHVEKAAELGADWIERNGTPRIQRWR